MLFCSVYDSFNITYTVLYEGMSILILNEYTEYTDSGNERMRMSTLNRVAEQTMDRKNISVTYVTLDP